jgi:hypothetical protein
MATGADPLNVDELRLQVPPHGGAVLLGFRSGDQWHDWLVSEQMAESLSLLLPDAVAAIRSKAVGRA